MNSWQTGLFLFWTFFIPAAAGGIFSVNRDNPFPLTECYMRGWILLFALAEILALPMIYWKAPLSTLTAGYALAALTAALAGLMRLFRHMQQGNGAAGYLQRIFAGISPWLVLAGVLILVQIAFVCRYAYMDADDSFYLGMAVTDVETNTIYSVNPYTGALYTAATFQSRYVLSAFPALLAVLSRLCGGVNPVILAHKRLAAPLFVLAYIVLHRMAQRLFPKDRHAQGRFLLFAVVTVWFSAYSAYNREDFMMVRIWQGKGAFAAILIPALLYYGITVFIDRDGKEPCIMPVLTSIACCLMTMLGIVAAPIIYGLCLLIGLAVGFRNDRREKSGTGAAEGVRMIGHYLLSIAPCLLVGAIYYMIR